MVTEEPNISDNSHLSTTAAALALGINRTTLYRACKSGAIIFQVARNGRRYYIGRHIKKYWEKTFDFSPTKSKCRSLYATFNVPANLAGLRLANVGRNPYLCKC